MHGEEHEAKRLKDKLEGYFGEQIKFEAPKNWETVQMKIDRNERIQLVGGLVEEIYKTQEYQEQLQGVYIKKKFKSYLCKEGEEYRILEENMMKMDQKIHFKFPHSLDLVFCMVQEVIEDLSILEFENKTVIKIRKNIVIYKDSEDELIMQWTSSEVNDIIGDCIGYMLFNIADYEDVDIFSKEKRSMEENAPHQTRNDDLLYRAICQNCGEQNVHLRDHTLSISNEKNEDLVVIDLRQKKVVKSSAENLRKKVENLINLIY